MKLNTFLLSGCRICDDKPARIEFLDLKLSEQCRDGPAIDMNDPATKPVPIGPSLLDTGDPKLLPGFAVHKVPGNSVWMTAI